MDQNISNPLPTAEEENPGGQDCGPFFRCYLENFHRNYTQVHQYLSVGTCIFGIVANILNIIVLTRRNMRNSINYLLTVLAVFQWALTFNYVLLQLFRTLREDALKYCLDSITWSKVGAWFMWTNVNANLYFHTMAFNYTLCLALFRFIIVRWPHKSKAWLRSRMALQWTIVLVPFTLCLCSPVFFSHIPVRVEENCSFVPLPAEVEPSLALKTGKPPPARQHREMVLWDLFYNENVLLLTLAFWMFSVLFKVLPCLGMIGLSFGLIISMRQAARRKKALLKKPSCDFNNSTAFGVSGEFDAVSAAVPTSSPNHEQPKSRNNNHSTTAAPRSHHSLLTCLSSSKFDVSSTGSASIDGAGAGADGDGKKRCSKSSVGNNEPDETGGGGSSTKRKAAINRKQIIGKLKRRAKTTGMLVLVVLVCVSVEMPHGILNLLTALYGEAFGLSVYNNLGDLIEFLTLFYSSVNFLFYCLMSTQFRATFHQLFIEPIFHRKRFSLSVSPSVCLRVSELLSGLLSHEVCAPTKTTEA